MIIKDKSQFHLVKAGPSQIHGKGVFARRRISKNTKIVHYNGEKVPKIIARQREARHAKKGELWMFEINRNWFVDAAVGGGIAKYVNHSETPNCWIHIEGDEIWYRASKTIHPGQELTVDYGTDLP